MSGAVFDCRNGARVCCQCLVWSPGMLLKSLQHTEQLPVHRIIRPQMPVVLRLRNPGFNTETTGCILSAPKVAVRRAERGDPQGVWLWNGNA